MRGPLESHQLAPNSDPSSRLLHLPALSPREILMRSLQLCFDQDNYCVEFLSLHLSMSNSLRSHKSSHPREVAEVAALLPHTVLDQYLCAIGHDHSVLVDFLINPETEFLEFLLRYLKLLKTEFQVAKSTLGPSSLKLVLLCFQRICSIISKLHRAGGFPYNPSPLIKRLNDCFFFVQ